MADFVKANDDEFFEQATMFYDFIRSTPELYGFSSDDVSDLSTKNSTFGTSLTDYNAKDVAARAARQQKDSDRAPDETQYRWMAKQFKSRPNVTNADLVSAGMPPRSERRGAVEPDLSQPPLVLVTQYGVHEHSVGFFMQGEESGSTKNPQGVDGAKIYLHIGDDAPTNLKEYDYIAFDKRQPYVYRHDPADAGKTANYIALWATDDDLTSPQSEVFSIKIT